MSSSALAGELTHDLGERLLVDEATTLDEGRLHDWLTMFTADAVYWLPARGEDADPDRHASLLYDDRGRMEERVWRLTHGPAHSQIPPSATQRLVTNIRVEERSSGPVILSNFAIFEVRRDEQRWFAGRAEHHVREEDGDWRFALKKVMLVNRTSPICNLTFIV